MTGLPTQHQQDVLDSKARIRVVKAVPGSGKTWLVAELIRREVEAWPHRSSGIAALSFTRVGGDEIRKSLGSDLDHPHFVGTIDAFLFRYVIRPFLKLCCPGYADPRLLPFDQGSEFWNKHGQVWIDSEKREFSVCGCIFLGEDVATKTPLIAFKTHPAQPLRLLEKGDARNALLAKQQLWQRSGQLTHSDASYLASYVLRHACFGPVVRREIIRRFPLIIVDELQDTGYFLGVCIRSLLAEPSVRGVAVGDPDQAIYEFTGATPELFDEFAQLADAKELPLPTSRRCCGKVTAVARHLKDTQGDLHPNPGAQGRAVLLRYTDMVRDVEKLAVALKAKQQNSVRIITRANETVYQLLRRSSKDGAQKLGSQPLTHMHRAVISLRQGKNGTALSASKAALELVVFGAEGLIEEDLAKEGVEPCLWRRMAADCLLAAADCVATGTIYEWQQQVGRVLDLFIQKSGLPIAKTLAPGKIKPKKIKEHEKPVSMFLPGMTDVPIVLAETVHAVKGETHDLTIFVCKDGTTANCPSKRWWSAKATDREHKRIAYVGMTRTKGDLFLCVSEACYARLRSARPNFVAAFETMTVDEFLASSSA